jgi:hypothetical protein
VFDIDGTLAMGGSPSARELDARRTARHIAQRHGATAFISYRTLELMMTSSEYHCSCDKGFTRPEPRVGFDPSLSEYRVNVPLESRREFDMVIRNADVIASAGDGIMVRHHGGYVRDTAYEMTSVRHAAWRRDVMLEILSTDLDGTFPALAPIEFPACYLKGGADVWPLPYRIQLDWSGPDAEREKMRIKRKLAKRFATRPHLGVRFVDESNPAKARCTLYLIHESVQKERMLERMLARVLEETGLRPDDLTVNIFGDTLTDLRQVYAAGRTFGERFGGSAVTMNFMLVGGSRLARPIQERAPTFCGEDLTWVGALLGAEIRPGVYEIETDDVPRGSRRFILGDEAYPGHPGPESIELFLSQLSQ